MAKVLLVQLNNDLTDILSLNLPLYIGFEVISKSNTEEALKTLEIFPDINVIIAPDKLEGENISLAIHNHLESAGLDIPLLIFGEVESLEDEHVMIKDRMGWREAISHCGEVLGLTPEALEKLGQLNFSPVPLHIFNRLEKSVCDLYLKIPNSRSEEGFKFIKRIPAEEKFEKNLFLKWEAFGVQNLYVSKDEREAFGSFVASSILNELDKENLSYGEKIKIQSHSYSFIQREIESLGVSPKVIEAATRTIDSMKDSIQENKSLSKFLKGLEKNKASYLYKHAILISFVASKILQQVEWGTEAQIRKMVFVAFFHDICLQHSDYCQIETEEELKSLDLAPADEAVIREHALKAAKIIRSIPDAPADVDLIIQHHHGSLTGKGFVEYITNKITPLGIIFILCEEYVNMLLKDKDFNQEDALVKLRDKYSRGSFQKAMDAISHLEL